MQNFIKSKYYALKNNLIKNDFDKRIPYIAAMFILTAVISVIVLCSVNTVNITDDTGTYTVRTFSDNVSKIMEIAGFGDDNYRVLNVKQDGRVLNLSVKRAFSVVIDSGNEKTKIYTCGGTVRDVLAEAGITLDEYDTVKPSANTLLKGKAHIDYLNVDYVTMNETEEIPCGMKTVYSNFVRLGTTTVQNGTNGIKQVTYTTKLVNGVECEKNVLDEQVITLAVDGVMTVGTGAVNAAAYNTYNYVNGCLTKDGGVYKNPYTGFKETWYSQKVLPGGGLTIPGRHVNSEGFVCDGDGYICIASSELPRGTIVPISRGIGKVYDSGCARGTIDVYVNW